MAPDGEVLSRAIWTRPPVLLEAMLANYEFSY